MSETQTTELMQDSALFDDVAKQALGRYEFDGDEAKLLTFSENYTYLVRNPITGSKDAVLRISRPGYHTREELAGEMAATSKASSDPMGQPISTLNTHTRYLHEGIVNYAEHLVALLPLEVDRVMFECRARRPTTSPCAWPAQPRVARASS